MLPCCRFHKFYWTGLFVPRIFPAFAWRDTTIPRPTTATWAYWGANEPASGGSELCGGSSANYTEPADNVWGWADYNCSSREIYMCRIMREWPLQGPLAPTDSAT
jgi:hypothetical protein